ncbi:MAG: acetylgalactosaminidase [Gemmatimonadetes bacterium]|nr:acetylgalactosaminidase [Gemmatimonadota bacterium]|tara:strand:+ start:2034 stop:3440 length:1407 start_codon:yes stop_codon:yes gene_type:complete
MTGTKNEIEQPDLNEINASYAQSHEQHHNMAGFRAPKIDTVRVGIIGMGNRGPSHLRTLIQIENVEIRGLCDKNPAKIDETLNYLENTDHDPVLYSDGEWKKLCEQDDIDLVVVTTPFFMHAPMSIYAMTQGKHVATEVPAAGTMEECWEIVQTAEATQRHLMMLENYSYMPFQLRMINMARKGFFGEVVHGDGAYNTSKMKNNFGKTMYSDMWWLRQYANRRGNIYPTHGIGPICQCMDINRGDRLDYLVSVESNDFLMAKRANGLAEQDSHFAEFAGLEYRGNMNTTVLRTVEGRTIVLQHDATTPSPHNMIHGVYGTKGAALYDPAPPRIANGDHKWVDADEFAEIEERYTPEIFRKMGDLTKSSGHGGSDLLMDWHLIDCLRNGLPLDQDVYDAASWSAIVPLSQWSVLNRSNSIDIPDFTAGAWESNPKNMDIELENGGATTRITSKDESADDVLTKQWKANH